MGLTIHWAFQGPTTKAEAETIMQKMRQRAMDLPFESVGKIVEFSGEAARFKPSQQNDPFDWLKIQAMQSIWSKDGRSGWDFSPQKIIGFQILVAPGSEPMEIILAVYPKTILVKDNWTGRRKRLRTNRHGWSGRGFTKTQYASDPECGGVPNFLRTHLSVCRMLDYGKELGLQVEVSDESRFFDRRDVPALVKTVGDWNEFIAAAVGGLDDLSGHKSVSPIKLFADYEHLEAKGQNQIDDFLRLLKQALKASAPAA